MCGGGSGNYGETAQGIGGMFGNAQTAPGMQTQATAPTPSGDMMSGIGSYMPMQQAAQAYAPTANFDSSQMYAAEAMYNPMAAAQARMDTMPQSRAMSVAELTPESIAAAEETQNNTSDFLTRSDLARMQNSYDRRGYNAFGGYNASRDMRP